MSRSLGHMQDDVFIRAIDGWQFFTEPVWLHLFGEPLLNPRLFSQIALAKSAGISNVGISTNATLLAADKVAPILDSGLDTIMLCIDGNSKQTYEAIRKSPVFTYEEVCANVRTFLDARRQRDRKKPRAILSIILMEENRSELSGFESTWRAAGADEVIFKGYTTWGGQAEHRFGALAPLEQRLDPPAPGPASRKNPCLNMWSSVIVAWDGRVLPCCFDFNATLTMGHLKKQSLAEIWNSPEYVALRTAELAQRNSNSLCRNCREAPGYDRDLTASEPV